MARNEIIISSGGGNRGNTSALKSITNVAKKTSTLEGDGEGKLKTLSRGLRTVRTGDLGSLGLFGGGSKGAIGMLVQEGAKLVNKGIDIGLDVSLASTGESVSIGNIKRIKGYILKPQKILWEATYEEAMRELRVNRQNIRNDYYRNLTGNLIYGKQYGEKR